MFRFLRKLRRSIVDFRNIRSLPVYVVWDTAEGALIDTHLYANFRTARKSYAELYLREDLCGLCMEGDTDDHTTGDWDTAPGHIQKLDVRTVPWRLTSNQTTGSNQGYYNTGGDYGDQKESQ